MSTGLLARTTSFSCMNDQDDYEEDLVTRRPLPWVVRVYFKDENSMGGVVCSGKCYTFILFKTRRFYQYSYHSHS